ncbi:hypothetical protein [Methylomicrobium album]|uniref:Knr4/Smi1-like domain-containing protein n=1 Tax=Methylomicrobium album BG8 TaxID=686340 RepID=H8GNQ7_METAL|nr:hypothetical protein [Methylomicrobium album]EIC30813.1 hypothetical protein Metal_3138 [Methylomicrobium album BG8]
MKTLGLLTEKEWPHGFRYPRQFNRIVELRLIELEPWYFLKGQPLREAMAGLTERYPARQLVPFARRQDNDDVACWDVGKGDEVFVIHDFASPGWEQRAQFASFYDWLRRAVEDFIEFDS